MTFCTHLSLDHGEAGGMADCPAIALRPAMLKVSTSAKIIDPLQNKIFVFVLIIIINHNKDETVLG